MAEAAARLFPRYYRRIRANHGVKEQNILSLYAPLGVPFAVLGPTLLPNLDSFGTLRGTHAHQSGKAVVSVLDPETEYMRVVNLVNELRALDAWLVEYRKRMR